VAFGGVKYGPQERSLMQGLDVLVATPGRLLDHMQQKNLDLSATEIFVLDEADQMLDLGFIKPIRQIVAHPGQAPEPVLLGHHADRDRQAGRRTAQGPGQGPVTPQATTVERINQSVIHIEQGRKRALLTEMFAETVHALPGLHQDQARRRQGRGLSGSRRRRAGAIHGNKSQPSVSAPWPPSRPASCACWSPPTSPPAASTSTAFRTYVNFELPHVPEAYVHRIGRTARAGKDGSAISFVAGDEMKLLRDIEKVTRQKIPSSDRRNDKSLALLDQSIMASGVKSKATMPDDGRGDRQQQRGPRNPRRDGVKLEGGGQPHRVRKPGPGREARPTPERAFDPMARERPRTTNNDPRHSSAPAAAKPDGEIKRRPRRRKPSNGGKGYVAKA
jgi:ATP-dependent RNA helicase RhlE